MPHGNVALLIVASLLQCGTSFADDPTSLLPTRVVEGSAVDDQGRPVTSGRIYFGHSDWRAPLTEELSTQIQADGHYRIEINGLPHHDGRFSANLPMRYLLLAPGFRPAPGKVASGPGPTTVNVRLIHEPWETINFRLIDQNKQPVKNAEVESRLVLLQSKEAIEIDESGLGRVSMPRGQGIQLFARSPNHATTKLDLRSSDQASGKVAIPMFNSIRGRVTDASGHPLPGIQIGQAILADHLARPGVRPRPPRLYNLEGIPGPTSTDDQGRFDLRPLISLDQRTRALRDRPLPLCFTDAGFQRLAFLRVDLHNVQPDYEVVLRPPRPLRITLDHQIMPPSGELSATWSLEPLPSLQDSRGTCIAFQGDVPPASENGHRLIAAWPEGLYRLTVQSADPDTQQVLEVGTTVITIPHGDGPFIQPPLRMTPVYQTSLSTRPAPELDAVDLKTGRPVKLSDFQGKLVVLTFWGSWFEPGIQLMSRLTKLQKALHDQPVAFITVHDRSVPSIEELGRELEALKQTSWNNRDLPFVVALDLPSPDAPAGVPHRGRGATIDRYKLPVLPVTLLIAPDGTVIHTLNLLDQVIAESIIRHSIK